jgi:hypothetical protein
MVCKTCGNTYIYKSRSAFPDPIGILDSSGAQDRDPCEEKRPQVRLLYSGSCYAGTFAFLTKTMGFCRFEIHIGEDIPVSPHPDPYSCTCMIRPRPSPLTVTQHILTDAMLPINGIRLRARCFPSAPSPRYSKLVPLSGLLRVTKMLNTHFLVCIPPVSLATHPYPTR